MIGLAFISFMRINGLNELSESVNHAHNIHVSLEKTYSRLRDADSELNSFLLTEDSIYYHKFLYAEKRIRIRIDKLKKLTQDDPGQYKSILDLDSIIRTRYTFMESSLRHPDADHSVASAQIARCNVMISDLIKQLIEDENRILDQREASVKAYKSATPVLLFTIQLVIIFFLFVVYERVVSILKLKTKLQDEIEVQIQFIKAVLDNSVNIVVVFDTEMKLIMANKKAKEQFGITDEMTGKDFFSFFPQARNARSSQELERAFKGEFRHITRHQSLITDRTLESFYIPLFKDGIVYAAILMHHDITDLVRTAEALEHKNQELQKSNAELERFAYVASHDLQEPLRKIQTYASLAQRQHKDAGQTEIYLQKIGNSAGRMTVLINEVLNYSRLNSGPIQIEKVDLNNIIEQVKADFELVINERKATILQASLPVVDGSGLQLFQVFSNLIGNALKFNTQPPVVKIKCEAHNTFYEISVSDNGIGFDPIYKDQIFEVFSRLQNPAEYAGTGIGLAVCKRIITNHKGTIQAHSTPGKGTTFIIQLPRPDDDVTTPDARVQSNVELLHDQVTVSSMSLNTSATPPGSKS